MCVSIREKWRAEKVKVNVTPHKNWDGTRNIGLQLSPNMKFLKAMLKNVLQISIFLGVSFAVLL